MKFYDSRGDFTSYITFSDLKHYFFKVMGGKRPGDKMHGGQRTRGEKTRGQKTLGAKGRGQKTGG